MTLCEVCGTEIRIMANRNSGVCSEDCRGAREEREGYPKRRRRRRDTSSSPSPQRRVDTF